MELWDLSSNFFLSEKDVGQNRAQACVPKLQELNNAVIISTITGDLTKEQLSNYQVHEHEMIFGVYRCVYCKIVYFISAYENFGAGALPNTHLLENIADLLYGAL